MNNNELKLIIESLLMVHQKPLSIDEIMRVFEGEESIEKHMIVDAINGLTIDFENRSIEIVEVANGYRIQTRAKYRFWVEKILSEKPAKYSKATLETLAIIAYRQPVTRGEIEEIRGVGVSSAIIRTLTEREWIKIAGYKDVPGKPAVYTTTKMFLDYFNLQTLDDLPLLDKMVEEFQE